jgi:beta-barrel assembly-enhancing protease
MGFKILYFDGKTSKTQNANLSVNSVSWKISYVDEFNTTITKTWDIYKIKRTEVYTGGLVSFSYGNQFPFQRIESTDPNFINYISLSELKNINSKLNTKIQKFGIKSIFLLLITIISISIFTYFFIIPAAANSFATNVSNKNVIAFGDYVFRVLSIDLDIDNEKSKKLQLFVDEMDVNSSFPLKLFIVNSDQKNAFAVSGGKIVIFSSLLEEIENENQLAALIGHEIAHIENRHVLKNVSRNLSGMLFISILFGDINSITAIISENAHLFSQLSFSRELEKEADMVGLEILKKNNLDLNGMPELFSILKESSEIEIPKYLSNHPILDERIRYTKEIANNQKHISENSILKEKWNDLKNTFK